MSKKLVFLIVTLTILTVILAGCFNKEEKQALQIDNEAVTLANPAPGVLKVHFIDVGQGDCILIQAPTGETMVIDGGPNTSTVETKIVNYIKNLGIGTINATVATHPHADHIGGLDAVIKNFYIVRAYDSGYAYTSQAYTDYKNALTAKSIPVYNARRGSTYSLSSNVTVTWLSPTSTLVTNPSDANVVSVVCRVTYGSTSFILTGDAPKFVETEIRTGGYTINSDVLKVGHHGSDTSSDTAFLDGVTPTKGAVILVGEGNTYGHPHAVTINNLKARSIPIYRTDTDGGINCNYVMTSNGTTITVQ